MSTKPNEGVSLELTEDRARELLLALPDVLSELLGSEVIEAMYGWAANLHIDLCWKPMQIGISWLRSFILESLDRQIIVPGRSDFIFNIRGRALEIEVCHDGHLHVSGTDAQLISQFLSRPPFSEIPLKVVENPTPEGHTRDAPA